MSDRSTNLDGDRWGLLLHFLPILYPVKEQIGRIDRSRLALINHLNTPLTRILVRAAESLNQNQKLVSSESESATASDVTRHAVSMTAGSLVLVWMIGAYTNYQINPTLVSISLTASGSLLLASADLLDGSSSQPGWHHPELRMQLQRTAGFHVFAIGFASQLIIEYLKSADVFPLPISPGVLNAVFIWTVLVCGLLLVSAFFTAKAIAGLGLFFGIIAAVVRVSSTLLGEFLAQVIGMGLLAAAVLTPALYWLHLGQRLLRGILSAATREFQFEDDSESAF